MTSEAIKTVVRFRVALPREKVSLTVLHVGFFDDFLAIMSCTRTLLAELDGKIAELGQDVGPVGYICNSVA